MGEIAANLLSAAGLLARIRLVFLLPCPCIFCSLTAVFL